jgi:2-succinyl-6-hydroxy-2,4-cyclohexadiene-1-carboxylate synthase
VLHVRRYGSGPTLVALHGFTSTGAQFSDLASRLHRTIVAPDLPGHGLSGACSTTLDDVCGAVVDVIRTDTLPTALIGYSQGGRLALLITVESPDLIDRLILISASAGIADHDARRRRAEDDASRAASLRRTDLDAFLDEWTRTGITSTHRATGPQRIADRHHRTENTVAGLADALEGYGLGAQRSVWEDLATVTIPVLLVTGSEDARYGDIADAMEARMPHAEHVVVAGAGHNPLLDRPEETAAAVDRFLYTSAMGSADPVDQS